MDRPKYTFNGQKHPHDLSHRVLFTSPTGMLLPVESDLLYPNDKIKIGFNLFTRMAELETAAFTRLREHIDVFFVPIQQLWSNFPQFIYSVGTPRSSIYQINNVNAHLPSLNPKVDYTTIDGETINLDNASRLLDMLGYGTNALVDILGSSVESNPPIGANILRIAAYHKIFYDYYALTDYTQVKNYLYNFDDCDLHDTNYIRLGADYSRKAKDFFNVHNRPWQLDYFTGVLPSPLATGESLNADSTLGAQINNWLGTNNIRTGSSEQANAEYSDNFTNVNTKDLNTANIRAMFAVEKLLEVTRRARKDYSKQTLAHFGTDVDEGISARAYKVGSISQDLFISDVDATASTEGALLGMQGGKGITAESNNRILEFRAPCHGILMAIYSAVPRADYAAKGLERQNAYSLRQDFFTPEFDNLGMQPLFGYELDTSAIPYRSNVCGWQYRYQESKESYDKVHKGFLRGLQDWVTLRSDNLFIPQGGLLPEKAFYVPSNALDSIMLVNYDGTVDTDPLRHCVDIIYHKSSVMSNYSLPTLSNNH